MGWTPVRPRAMTMVFRRWFAALCSSSSRRSSSVSLKKRNETRRQEKKQRRMTRCRSRGANRNKHQSPHLLLYFFQDLLSITRARNYHEVCRISLTSGKGVKEGGRRQQPSNSSHCHSPLVNRRGELQKESSCILTGLPR